MPLEMTTCMKCSRSMGAGSNFCHRCKDIPPTAFSIMAISILVGVLAMIGCVSAPKVHRVRFKALKLDVIAYETQAQASRQCKKHIARWEKVTGLKHRLDDGTFAGERTEYNGCHVAPLHAGLNSHIIASIQSIQVICHELCHALGAKRDVCESIRFDATPIGRTINVPEPTEEE